MARILVAEDDEPVRVFVRKALEMDGHIVTTAEDGGLALDVLIEQNGAFDLLLSDIRMPMMDGIALALSAARHYPNLPILLMTGYAEQRERASELDAIIEDVITKPFALADLRELVSKTLEKRATLLE
jgi:two-component system, cell cycle response regulator CpdR